VGGTVERGICAGFLNRTAFEVEDSSEVILNLCAGGSRWDRMLGFGNEYYAMYNTSSRGIFHLNEQAKRASWSPFPNACKHAP